MSSNVFIVHCIDTEGPLDETIQATFERLEEIFGIKLKQSKTNLKKLQNQEIDLGGLEVAVANLVAPQRLNMNRNWQDISSMLETLNDPSFRMKVPDSNNNGWCYSWFCLDHHGFKGNNPRNRDTKDHSVFDFYQNNLKTQRHYKDCIQWHYHPIPINGHLNSCGNTYLNSSNIWEILAKKIIERSWFPSAFRPGFHTERPDSNWFLEQWIPFDYANQSTKNLKNDQPDLSNGRFGDWRNATTDWKPYHPSHDNYQLEGSCRRWIARCLNMEARIREINQEEFYTAFQRASEGLPALVSFSNHDFRNMKPEIEKVQTFIKKAAEKFPNVHFTYENAITGFQKYLKLSPRKPMLDYSFSKDQKSKTLTLNVKCKNDIFGPQPFLAIKTLDGNFYWQNFDFREKNSWSFCFDTVNISADEVSQIGIAANSTTGVSEVLNISAEKFAAVRRNKY